jgi:Flp pilus assembly protein TadD
MIVLKLGRGGPPRWQETLLWDFSSPRTGGAPYLARFSRDVGDREPFCSLSIAQKNRRLSAVVSHISRKTSEMWGPWSVARKNQKAGLLSALLTQTLKPIPFLLAALFVCLSALAQQVTSLERGLELFRQEKYEAALQQFQDARRSRPADATLANFIGITETRLGRIDQANADYKTAIRLDPRLAGPHTNLGFNYLGKKQYELAETQLKAALALDSADPFVHYYLATLYLTTSREKDAIPHIKPAEPLLENDPAAAVLAIAACLKFNASAEAMTVIGLLDQHSHLSAEQEYQIAKLLDEQQMYVESAARFRRIAEMQPASWQSQYNLAVALIKAKQSKESLPLLASLATEHASDADVLASVASAYESANENALALDAYQRAIAADPANPDRYLDCTRLLIDRDRYQEAREIVQRGITLVPDDYPLTIRLGAIAMMSGNRDQARDDYHKAIAEHPALALGYVALAQTYMKEGKDQEALKVLTDGRAAVPRDFALEYVFGLVSFQLSQQKQAMEALKNAEEMQPAVVEPHYQLGLLYMQLQQWNGAQQEFEHVLKLDPNNAPTYYQLSRTYQRLGKTDKAQEMAKEASLLTRTQREDAIKAQELRFSVPRQN